jgi:hypothetical protein
LLQYSSFPAFLIRNSFPGFPPRRASSGFQIEVREGEGAFTSTRGACAPQNRFRTRSGAL